MENNQPNKKKSLLTIIQKTVGDGHCFNRAISLSISGTQRNFSVIRTQLHLHMLRNLHLGEFFNLHHTQFLNYLQNSGPVNALNRAQWATEIEIYFMCHLLQTDINIFKNTLSGVGIDTPPTTLLMPNQLKPKPHMHYTSLTPTITTTMLQNLSTNTSQYHTPRTP